MRRPTLSGRAGLDLDGYGPGISAPFGRSETYKGEHHGQDYFWLGAASAKRYGISTAASQDIYPVEDGTLYPIDSDGLGTGAWQQIDSTHRAYYWHMSRRIHSAKAAVDTGHRIGVMGDSGWAAAPGQVHLHFEIRRAPYGAGDRIDPEPFFRAPVPTRPKDDVKRVATYLNGRNLGKTSSADKDGIPGPNLYWMIQKAGTIDKVYNGEIDGITGPRTEKAFDHYVALTKPKPTPPPVVEPEEPIPTPPDEGNEPPVEIPEPPDTPEEPPTEELPDRGNPSTPKKSIVPWIVVLIGAISGVVAALWRWWM